ncbi:hypothetical protein [Pseudosporangium ferrugineum]|uniref:Excreted virulence factor EspC (Type VII ESX diderm) n=1 Tax=Pseudosporangium ferrugineum TaxID=439699 RepID=A0A2T0RSD5_9ACTN|nr:hypothetical protein [Pseudosporangium ferrugineum]PRY24020.1 excreted virulence factor EspC (type VII ESX diderm) [Pseudosporangium ferrugineum]
MTGPTPEQVTVATNALRNEAGEWDEQSGKLATLSSTVAGMEFGRLEAGLFQLMVGPYNDVIHAVSARCQEGASAMTGIGSTLRDVANTYDAEDKANEHRIRNIY